MHPNVTKYIDPLNEEEQRLLRAETFLHFDDPAHWTARSHIRVCAHCGRLYRFNEKRTTSQSKNQFVCSDACQVWSKILVGDEDECWPFMSSRDSHGYGWLKVGGVALKAHRLAFKFANGHLPKWTGKADGPVVMHMCDNRACCNPNHLKIGTQDENISDMVQKGRCRNGRQPTYDECPRGEKHGNTFISEETARYILESIKTAKELADELGTSLSLVKQIRNGRTWGHVTFTPPNEQEREARRKDRQAKARSRPIVIDGVEYESRFLARKSLGVSRFILNKMLSNDEPKRGNKKRVEYNGVVYDNKELAAKEIGVCRKTLNNWVASGKVKEVE